jgi:hypothetical protein
MDQFQKTDPNPSSSLFQMNLDAQNSYNLRSASSWAKVLGVVGIITGAVIVIWMAVQLSKLNRLSDYGYRRGAFDNIFEARTGIWTFIISGVIFIVGGIFSFNFGNKINQALKSSDQDGLNSGFAALRNYFALRAITIIILLLLFLIVIGNTI